MTDRSDTLSSAAPSMAPWSAAWRTADAPALSRLYARQGIVLHPKRPVVQERAAIMSFFEGGLGKLHVHFDPSELFVRGDLAFETGTYRDVQPSSSIVVATGTYAVTWIWEDEAWRILCHAWNAPTG